VVLEPEFDSTKAHRSPETQTPVAGRVVDSASAFGYGIYEVRDATGTMWVRTGNMPADRSAVLVTGTLQSGVSVLGIDVGWHLKEQERQWMGPGVVVHYWLQAARPTTRLEGTRLP